MPTSLNGQQVGTTPVNPINDASPDISQGLNTFNLHYYNALTARFGEITPFGCLETFGKDAHQLISKHELRTFTMSAPLLSPVRLNKSYYWIPMKSLMPKTWDILYKNPKRGDDIPDSAKPKFDLQLYLHNLVSEVASYQTSLKSAYWIYIFYNLFSTGSLLHYFNVVLPDKLYAIGPKFDTFLRGTKYGNVDIDGVSAATYFNTASNSIFSVSHLRRIISLIPNHNVRWYINTTNTEPFGVFVAALTDLLGDSFDIPTILPVNLLPILSYKQTCAQFFTKDDVDNIYDSSLFMQNLTSVANTYLSTEYLPTFTYNGIRFEYDIFSNKILTDLSDQPTCPFWVNIFGYEYSIKFGDYFVGARTRPLAVGDVEIEVGDSGKFSVVDVTQNIIKQRLLNNVNRIRSSITQYTKSVFGVASQEIDSQPQFIGRSTTLISNPEVENTANDQGVITSALRSADGKYEFQMRFTDPGYMIALVSFDVIPCYPSFNDRRNYHFDRYDFFNPMLQNVGDQVIYRGEINPSDPHPESTFAFTQRYQEYKIAVNQCHGGFANPEVLPSWLYIDDSKPQVINSDFIRYKPSDFDRFYSSLTGIAQDRYFHFQIIFNNELDSNRGAQNQSSVL